MSEVSGVIQSIDARSVAGGKTAYDIVVAGQRYGAGFFQPKVKVGDYVTFTAAINGNFKNVERGTLKASAYKPEAADAAPASGARPAVKQAVSSFDARQDAISRQAASNTAIAWVGFLHSAGALPVGSKSKGALQAALDTIREEYEKSFYERNTGVEWKDISPNPQVAEDSEDSDAGDSPEDIPWK